MSDVVFTLPGKLGDNLAKLPIAYRYARTFGKKVDIAVDKLSAPSLLPLLEKLTWVDKAFYSYGIRGYGCGGNPVDFGRDDWNSLYSEVYHLGFAQDGSHSADLVQWSIPPNYPPQLRTMGDWFAETPLEFSWTDYVCHRPKFPVICAKSSRAYADAATNETVLHAGIHQWKDVGKLSLYMAAKAMAMAPCVITTYSAMSILAALIQAPCIVLIPEGGTGLPHYDARTPFYDGWHVVNEYDSHAVRTLVERITNRGSNA